MDHSPWYRPQNMANEKWTMDYSPCYLHLSVANGMWTALTVDYDQWIVDYGLYIDYSLWYILTSEYGQWKVDPWTIVHGTEPIVWPTES